MSETEEKRGRGRPRKPVPPRTLSDEEKLQLVRDVPLVFAQTYLRDPSNHKKRFKANWMQIPMLKPHGNRLNTVRAQRGCGKTVAIIAYILWFAYTKPYQNILIVGPYKRTVERVFAELNKQIDLSEDLLGSIARRRQNPMEIVLKNGTRIEGQSTNVSSKSAGQQIRGWHGQLMYIDEADYLDDKDWESFGPLIDPPNPNDPRPIVWATTTPTGRRSYFYELCEHKEGEKARGKDWKDWWFAARHIPDITFKGTFSLDHRGFPKPDPGSEIFCSGTNPDWPKDADDRQWRVLQEQGYYHEMAAWWGDATSSVFPKSLIKEAMDRGLASKFTYMTERVQGSGQLFTAGVDVDKMQATPNICVVEYVPNKSTKDGSGGNYIVRFREELQRVDRILVAMRLEIQNVNANFQPRAIYMDRGYGDVSVEELNALGLTNVHGKWFRENAVIVNPTTGDMEKKPLKHVMIAMAQRMFEDRRITIPPIARSGSYYNAEGYEVFSKEPIWDDTFITQLMNYQVVNVTKTGVPEYTSKDEHAIDAFLLALWAAIELFDNPYELQISDEIISTDLDETNLFGVKRFNTPEETVARERGRKYVPCTLEEFKTGRSLPRLGDVGSGRSFAGFERSSF